MILYDKKGQIRGRIENDKVYSRSGAYLGFYDENVDKTYDKRGMLFGSGDQRALLLED
jgi:hypothetical protein